VHKYILYVSICRFFILRNIDKASPGPGLIIWYEYVEIKCQLDATEVFIADLIACSTCFGRHCAHHQELKSVIRWLLPVVFRAEGYVYSLEDAAASCKPDT